MLPSTSSTATLSCGERIFSCLDDFFNVIDRKYIPFKTDQKKENNGWHETALKICAYFIFFPFSLALFGLYCGLGRHYTLQTSSTENAIPTTAPSIKDKEFQSAVLFNEPIGLSNYGQSCWFGSGLQILLANRFFEESAQKPILAQELTEEQQHNKQTFQTALAKVFQTRQNGIDAFTKSVKNLHKTILNLFPDFPGIGHSDAPNTLFKLLRDDLLDEDFFYCSAGGLLKPGAISNQWLKESLSYCPHPRKILCLYDDTGLRNVNFLNQVIDLNVKEPTSHEKDFRYRIVGFAVNSGRHWISYNCYSDQWFLCDDHTITIQPVEEIPEHHWKSPTVVCLELIVDEAHTQEHSQNGTEWEWV